MFEYGHLAEELTVFMDSDWACCKETRKSLRAGVMMLGAHTLKAYTRKQKVIAKRSAEAELYAAALGVSEAKGVESMMCDLGFAVKPVLAIDEHILHRQGIGKLKHVDVPYLWVQDEIRSQRLRVRRVRSEENVADLGTKPLSKTVIAKHCLTLGYVNMDEKNVMSGWQVVAMFWDNSSAPCDHVQKTASREPQQQKQLQDSQQRQHASGNFFRYREFKVLATQKQQ